MPRGVAPPGTRRGRLERPPRRVSFRVTSRWQNRQTHANGRERRQKLEDAKSLKWRALRRNRPSSLGFHASRSKNPTLSASLRSTSSSFGLARLSAWPRSQRATKRRRLSRRSTRSVRRRTFCERLSVRCLQELRTPGRPPRRFHAIPRTRAWIACCRSHGLWRQSPSCMSFEAVAIQIGITLA